VLRPAVHGSSADPSSPRRERERKKEGEKERETYFPEPFN